MPLHTHLISPKNVAEELIKREMARRHLADFTKYTFQSFDPKDFHLVYYKILDMFATGEIARLIVTVPPQHGKSEGSTRRLPAYMLGKNPDLKIAVASYNQSFVRKFSRDIRRIMKDNTYKKLFPKTIYPDTAHNDYTHTVDEFELPYAKGGIRFVGRGGPLTGNPVDIMIMDDLYKDYAEGNSPTIRAAVTDWYSSVVRTRLHNTSRQLIVFTRWHEEDLVGYLEKTENVITLKTWDDLKNVDKYTWVKINFPAIQINPPSELDTRNNGEALWPEKHELRKLEGERDLDVEKFESLYQGDPRPMAGLLFTKFQTYIERPKKLRYIGAYIDTADTGNDWLACFVYILGTDGQIYIIDVLYTNAAMEETEPLTAEMLHRHRVDKADVESNSGGRGFARNVQRILAEKYNYSAIQITAFHQSANKESRILSNCTNLQRYILFPVGCENKWPTAFNDIMRFRKNFKSNTHDDVVDALTGVWEKTLEFVDRRSDALYKW
jgi:predicted phage terminase large subunit-like protein